MWSLRGVGFAERQGSSRMARTDGTLESSPRTSAMVFEAVRFAVAVGSVERDRMASRQRRARRLGGHHGGVQASASVPSRSCGARFGGCRLGFAGRVGRCGRWCSRATTSGERLPVPVRRRHPAHRGGLQLGWSAVLHADVDAELLQRGAAVRGWEHAARASRSRSSTRSGTRTWPPI